MSSNAYFRQRTRRLNAVGLTAHGTPIKLRHRYELDARGLTGMDRKREYKRIRRAELAALGRTARGTVRVLGVPRRNAVETAWLEFRATLQIQTPPEILTNLERSE